MKYRKMICAMLVAMTILTWVNVMLGNVAGTIFCCTVMLILSQELRHD